jgi:hypothetical protein
VTQEYTDWETWGKPDCWCFPRQCKGDINGLKTGPFWVQQLDRDIFRAAFNKNDTALATVELYGMKGICADIDHIKTGPFRVGQLDRDIFRAYFNKGEVSVPCCDANGDCTLDASDKFNFWTSP